MSSLRSGLSHGQALQKAAGQPLRFVFRNFPLINAHPYAEHSAEAAESAAVQGHFWEMHDMLFENQRALEDRQLVQYASELGLDARTLINDLQEQRFAQRVREDFMSGIKSGVNGTPTFFINGIRYDGDYDVESMLAALEQAAPPEPGRQHARDADSDEFGHPIRNSRTLIRDSRTVVGA